MSAGTVIVVGMATATVASAVTQGILVAVQKPTEAGYVDLATKSLLATTALGIFAKLVKAMGIL